MIKLGVTSCFFYPDLTRTTYGPKTLCYLENDMANYLYRDDVLPILIPDLDDDKLLHFLDQMDAFLLQGGADVAPESYGDEPIENGQWPGDKYRDDYELKIMDYAFKSKKPTLGICRGFQIMNVYFGGKLHQDIATEKKSKLIHRDAVLYDKIQHDIEFREGGLLHEIYKNESLNKVNSVHHQCVKTLGKNLVWEAKCPNDDIIEAFSYNGDQERFIFAVQWHPEFFHTLENELINAHILYEKFLEKVRHAN